MNVIYLKGELSFWIIQHNLFTYILPHSILKASQSHMSISCFMISFANNDQNFEMPDSVNYYKYKGSAMEHSQDQPNAG